MRREAPKDIACADNIVARENLPLPVVLYPGFYGAFFGFREIDDSPIMLCSCAKEAIENYLRFRLCVPRPDNADHARGFVLDCMYFPRTLVESLIQRGAPDNHRIIQCLSFRERLCHECNRVVPTYGYCHEMYGGAFKQNYGWYINKQGYEWGVEPISSRILPDVCPQEILALVGLDPLHTPKQYQKLMRANSEEADRLWKKFQKQTRRVRNVIENEVRQRFGHKKIGEAWISETILYHIVRSLFPHLTVRRHYRPRFLQGLELDIFIDELNVGIEYQGIQHYKPVKHWGGQEAFKRLRARDLKKKQICVSLGIPIVYFKSNEGLSDETVMTKLRKHTGA